MKLLGVTIDKDLNFTEHVADIVRRISNQIQVMQRHKKLINTDTKTKLYNAYLLPHLYIITVSCGTIAVNAVKLMNAAYDLFSMIMTVIICNYLIVWDNHHYSRCLHRVLRARAPMMRA